MKLFLINTGEDEPCGYCNWDVTNRYWLANTEEQALDEFKNRSEGNNPLCGDCMCELIATEGWNINEE